MSDNALTVIVLTRNEERDLARCLEAARELGPPIVIDSGSTDRTREIAMAHGARIFDHVFAGFGQQRNWALENCGVATEWVLFLDADEIATLEFRRAVKEATTSASAKIAGFYCCWKTLLDGTWLKRSDSFPKWQFRLLRLGRATFRDAGHGQKEGTWDGEIGYIAEPYLHEAFSKGWADWCAKHERYATQEAIDRSERAVCWRDLFARDSSQRNMALKPFLSRVPGWPLLRFVHMFFLKGGFLEGRAGFRYCAAMANYERIIRAKMAERRQARESAV